MDKQRSSSPVPGKGPVASSPNITPQPNTWTAQAALPVGAPNVWAPLALPWRALVIWGATMLVGTLLFWQFMFVNAPMTLNKDQTDDSSAAGAWLQAPSSVEERLCTQFIQLKNAADAAAFNLLGPAPTIPNRPISRAEADHLQAEFFLRENVEIVGVGRDRRSGALVLYTKGNVFAPTLQVKTTDGVETAQRTMSNPDLTVEVRDGCIYGVAANLHVGP